MVSRAQRRAPAAVLKSLLDDRDVSGRFWDDVIEYRNLEEEDEGGESEFVRTGFYLGVGGTAAFPNDWNSEFDDHFNKEASDLANANAQEALDAIPPPPPLPADEIIPLSVMVNGAELEDAQFGVNGVIGYRAGPLVAFEVEGEWLLSCSTSGVACYGEVAECALCYETHTCDELVAGACNQRDDGGTLCLVGES